MPEIQNVFILKDGIPIFHVNPITKLIDMDVKVESKTKNMDSALIAGFLSAIASFASEIGIGNPITYETSEMKFSFLTQNDFLFILGTTNLQESDIQLLLKDIAQKFLDMIVLEKINPKIADLSPFNLKMKEILLPYVQKLNLLKEPALPEKYVQLVPQSHIVPDALEKLSETRRFLFKLINGANSISDIAKATQLDPHTLFSILRSYTKNGLITFV